MQDRCSHVHTPNDLQECSAGVSNLVSKETVVALVLVLNDAGLYCLILK